MILTYRRPLSIPLVAAITTETAKSHVRNRRVIVSLRVIKGAANDSQIVADYVMGNNKSPRESVVRHRNLTLAISGRDRKPKCIADN